MNNPNRTKNKLRKIYQCLGINCDFNKTNGMMIDDLEFKAECGELSGVTVKEILIKNQGDDSPVIIDCTGKTYFCMFVKHTNCSPQGSGIHGTVELSKQDYSYTYSSSGMTAGIMSWTAETKTLKYEPNLDYNRGSIPLIIITF